TYDMAMKLKRKYKAEIQFNEERKTPFFKYEDGDGNQHEVWFENQQSIEAKTRLANELGVQGVALWRLGMEDPAIWPMINEKIVVERTE
ncbi:MAG: glycosyl hydrolase, partial [Anaerobacillus sp.]